MFTQLNPPSKNQRGALAASLIVHALFFTWLLHTPAPKLLTPVSIAIGHSGNVLTKVYWPSRSPDNSSTNSSDSATQHYRHQRLGHEKLVWKPTAAQAKLAQQSPPVPAEDDSKTTTLSKQGHGGPAGLPYGTLVGGPLFGDEIRPALPVATADPVIYSWERPESEGKVVIEITIDDRGEIVGKTVLQSLGSEIDNKCLAALENWRFQPATRNGTPIVSKQDAIFPFKARG
jgi:TonB family protein